jgi:hypothetical protein
VSLTSSSGGEHADHCERSGHQILSGYAHANKTRRAADTPTGLSCSEIDVPSEDSDVYQSWKQRQERLTIVQSILSAWRTEHEKHKRELAPLVSQIESIKASTDPMEEQNAAYKTMREMQGNLDMNHSKRKSLNWTTKSPADSLNQR